MKRHILYEVDLERQVAFCVVCGYTEIYIAPTRTRVKPHVSCINKANQLRANKLAKYYSVRDDRRPRSNWQPRHELSEINPETLTAICAVCGPTDINKTTSKGNTRYYCATKQREYMRAYRRSHYVARSTNPHALSAIDEENRTAVCLKCGPVKIEIWLGKKKINRRCINAKEELIQAKQN